MILYELLNGLQALYTCTATILPSIFTPCCLVTLGGSIFQGFFNFTARRPRHLLQILELGYNVMYNDVDMVWLADPFPYLEGEHDVYFMDDMAYVSLLIALSFKFANVNNNTLLVLSKPLRTGFSNIFSASDTFLTTNQIFLLFLSVIHLFLAS